MKDLKIVLVGMGAIGGSVATLIKEAGCDITAVVRHPEVAKEITENGYTVTGLLGTKKVKIPTVSSLDELQGPYDVAFIATKTYQLTSIAKQLLKHLSKKAYVVAMQNGMVLEDLAYVVGDNRAVGCVIGYGATLTSPTSAEITSMGQFVIGTISGDTKEDLIDIQSTLGYVFPTVLSNDILGELYSKLIINACISAMGAISGLYLGELLRIKHVRNLFLEIMQESMSVANLMKIQVPPYAGKLDYYKFLEKNHWFSRFKAHLIIRIFGSKYRRLKSSSLTAIERGRKTEVDYLNGYISRKAESLGVDTPVCDRLVELVHEIENKQRIIDVSNLYDDELIRATT